jgi:general secretion pathway protein C
MSSRWTGFFIWALVAACVAFWGLKIFAATRPVPAGAQAPQPPVAVAGPMVRLFGALPTTEADDNTPPPASDRFQLVGVIAPREGAGEHSGIAIVSIDNQPARPWHVGSQVEDGGPTLLAVAKRAAEFGPQGGPAAFTLQLPEPQPPATGTLPAAVSQPNGPAPQPRPMPPAAANPQVRPNMQFQGARPLQPNPNLPRLGAMPGQAIPAQMPSGRTPPTPGQVPPQPQGDNQRDEE